MNRIILFITACFCVIIGIYSASFLPSDSTQLIEEKYNSWSGVIRIWVSSDCNATSMLNVCASIAEKRLNGIYFHIQEVPASAIANYNNCGINLPDIIIYPSSAAPDTCSLEIITASYPLRNGIIHDPYAVPILLNAKFWIYNTSTLDQLPGDMYSISTACSETDLNSLVALSTGLRNETGMSVAIPGMDLGLSGSNDPTPSPIGETVCRIGPNLSITDNARSIFSSGKADAFVGDISDVLKLSESSGWAACITGEYIYTNDAIMLSIISKNDSRISACIDFLDVIMTDGQTLAARAQAFPAITGLSVWSGDITLASIEASLEGRTWVLSALNNRTAAQLYIEGKLTADEAMAIIIKDSQ